MQSGPRQVLISEVIMKKIAFVLLFLLVAASCFASVNYGCGVYVGFYGSAIESQIVSADESFFSCLCPGILVSVETDYIGIISRFNWYTGSSMFRGSLQLKGIIPIGRVHIGLGIGYRFNIDLQEGFSWGDGITNLKFTETPLTLGLTIDFPISSGCNLSFVAEYPTLFIPSKMNFMDLKFQFSDKETALYLVQNTIIALGLIWIV